MITSVQKSDFTISDESPLTLVGIAIHELMIGLTMALPLHLLFGGLYVAGRAVDIQAGFGLALLIDPTTRAQVPLIGTLLAYLTGAVFFINNGHGEVLRILASSINFAPPSSLLRTDATDLAIMAAQFVTMLSLALGLVGGLLLAMLACDVVVALLSRTVPQMNALMLGIQVKVIVMLAILPLVIGFAAGRIVRMIAITLESMPSLV
jgi:flagellar biosynthesis protein FliR